MDKIVKISVPTLAQRNNDFKHCGFLQESYREESLLTGGKAEDERKGTLVRQIGKDKETCGCGSLTSAESETLIGKVLIRYFSICCYI